MLSKMLRMLSKMLRMLKMLSIKFSILSIRCYFNYFLRLLFSIRIKKAVQTNVTSFKMLSKMLKMLSKMLRMLKMLS